MKGTIQRYNYRKGFGFIEGDDGREYFFHYTDFEDNKRQIRPERTVDFVAGTNDKGLFASKVSLLDRDDSDEPVNGHKQSSGSIPRTVVFFLGLAIGAAVGYFSATGLG